MISNCTTTDLASRLSVFGGLQRATKKRKRPPRWRPCHPKSSSLRCYPRRRLRRGRSRSSSRGGLIQNPVVDGEQRQLQPVRHADFVIHIAQIVLDHLLGGAELCGDLFVFVA